MWLHTGGWAGTGTHVSRHLLACQGGHLCGPGLGAQLKWEQILLVSSVILATSLCDSFLPLQSEHLLLALAGSWWEQPEQ